MSRDPNFLFIGAARCASTWVHECLKAHPDVCVPRRPKELNFFNREANYQRGLDWYRAYWEHASDESAIGEVTPTYLCHEPSAQRIHNHYPDIRLIVTLRNPIERTYSAFRGHVLAGRISEDMTLAEADAALTFDNQSSLLEHACYARHLERYFAMFSRHQFLIQLYDDIQPNPATFIQRIYAFLGVDDRITPDCVSDMIHAGLNNGGIASAAVRGINRIGLALKPVMGRTHRYYEYGARAIRNCVLKPAPADIPPRIVDELQTYYHAENQRLAELIGRDLSAWNATTITK